METQDPDDVLALCVLAAHPRVRLLTVTLNPGSREQVGVVRHVLRRLDAGGIPVGSRDPARSGAVSAFHQLWLGEVAPEEPDAPADELLFDAVGAGAVLLSGAPLHNVRTLLARHSDAIVDRWVAQGGYAGDSVVPPEARLAKFAGREMVESHNFGANSRATRAILADPRVRLRQLVSKNVTHGVVWDEALQKRIGALTDLTAGLRLAHEAMSVYLKQVPAGKALHDPLAACAAIDPRVVEWAEVRVLYGGGRWGAAPEAGTGTFISVAVDRDRFFDTLVAA